MLLAAPVIRTDGTLEVHAVSPPAAVLRLGPAELVVLRLLLGAGGAARQRALYAALWGEPSAPIRIGRKTLLDQALGRLRAHRLLRSPPGAPVAALSAWGMDLAAWLLHGWDGWAAYGRAIARRPGARQAQPALDLIVAALADGSWCETDQPLATPPDPSGRVV